MNLVFYVAAYEVVDAAAIAGGATCNPITSYSECAEAAVELDITMTANEKSGSSTIPPGCSVNSKTGVLRFDTAGDNTGNCWRNSPCICNLGKMNINRPKKNLVYNSPVA